MGTTSSDWAVNPLTSTVPNQVDPTIDNPTLPNATVTFVQVNFPADQEPPSSNSEHSR